jgi:hypothetical protein
MLWVCCVPVPHRYMAEAQVPVWRTVKDDQCWYTKSLGLAGLFKKIQSGSLLSCLAMWPLALLLEDPQQRLTRQGHLVLCLQPPKL